MVQRVATDTFRHPSVPSITVRPLPPGDEDVIRRVFDGMSPRSRRLRFLAAMPAMAPATVRQLADVDHVTSGAWVARDGNQVIGIGRYVRVVLDDGVESAEIAVEVVDTYQRRGVGRLLVNVLATVLRDLGVDRWHWSGHPANEALRGLTKRAHASWSYADGVVVGHAAISPN